MVVHTRDEDSSDNLKDVGVGHIKLLREEEDSGNHQHLEIKLRSRSRHCYRDLHRTQDWMVRTRIYHRKTGDIMKRKIVDACFEEFLTETTKTIVRTFWSS